MLEKYFDACLKLRLPQPILFMRYETLWNNLDVLFNFLDLPTELRSDFPPYKERKSKLISLPYDTQEQLKQIYSSLSNKIDALPDYFIRSPAQSD